MVFTAFLDPEHLPFALVLIRDLLFPLETPLHIIHVWLVLLLSLTASWKPGLANWKTIFPEQSNWFKIGVTTFPLAGTFLQKLGKYN